LDPPQVVTPLCTRPLCATPPPHMYTIRMCLPIKFLILQTLIRIGRHILEDQQITCTPSGSIGNLAILAYLRTYFSQQIPSELSSNQINIVCTSTWQAMGANYTFAFRWEFLTFIVNYFFLFISYMCIATI